MLAGGILGMVGRRVGLLDDNELQAIRAARSMSWLRGLTYGGNPAPADAAQRPQRAGSGNSTQRAGNRAFRPAQFLLSRGSRSEHPEMKRPRLRLRGLLERCANPGGK